MWDNDELMRLPTRSGIATGHSNERTLAEGVDKTSFVTRVRQNADGSTTMLRTRGGALEYTTVGPEPEEDKEYKEEFDWVYSLPATQKDGSGNIVDAYTIRNTANTPHKVPMTNYTWGPKTRRSGLVSNSDGTVSPRVKESKYEGQYPNKRVGGGRWISLRYVVTWGLPVGRGRFDNDTNGEYLPAEYHTVQIYDRMTKKWSEEICENVAIADVVGSYLLSSACVVTADDGTKMVRLLKCLERKTTGKELFLIQDFTMNGVLIRSAYSSDAITGHPVATSIVSASGQAWSKDGKKVVLLVVDNALPMHQEFSVSCPATGTAIAIIAGSIVTSTGTLNSYSSSTATTYQQPPGYSETGEIVYAHLTLNNERVGEPSLVDYPSGQGYHFQAGTWPVSTTKTYTTRLFVGGTLVYSVADENYTSFINVVEVNPTGINGGPLITRMLEGFQGWGSVSILDMCHYSKVLCEVVMPNRTNYNGVNELGIGHTYYTGASPTDDAFIRIVQLQQTGEIKVIESPKLRVNDQFSFSGAWNSIDKKFLFLHVGKAGSAPFENQAWVDYPIQSSLYGFYYRGGVWRSVVWGSGEPTHNTIWPAPFYSVRVSPFGKKE